MSLLHELNREWTELLSRSPIPGWSDSIPEAVACVCAGDVLALVPDFAEEVLSSLVRLAQDGDQLAARTVLQAMLPKLVRMSRTGRARARHDAFDDLVAAMATSIRTHPQHRASSTAGNLALDSLKDAQRMWAQDCPPAEVALAEETLTYLAGSTPTLADLEAEELLGVGRDHGWISDSMHDLLVATYGSHGEPSATVAARLGCEPATVRSRCRSGVAHLRTHREQLLELV